jgi:PAS domain S-box-containing protein
MTCDNFPVLLHACEQELTAIYENVPGIVFYIAIEPDGEFRFVSVSRDFLTATGLSRDQVVGSLVRDVIPPPSRDVVLTIIESDSIRSASAMGRRTVPRRQRCGGGGTRCTMQAVLRRTSLAVHGHRARGWRVSRRRSEPLRTRW